MKPGSDIEKRVEEALNSLDGIKRATPQPWLFSRVKARLSREEAEERTVWGTIGSFLSRPVVAVAGVCLILLFNGVLLFNQQSRSYSNGIAIQNEMQPSDSESFVASNSSFDFENLVQP